MARFDTALNEHLREFIAAQHIFFTASAPTQGRINLSPKGLDSFRVLDERTVAWLDLTGSENETAAHLAQNGRLTVMFCSFADKPLIVRIYGHGRVVRPQDPDWEGLHGLFRPFPGERQIVVVAVDSIMSTCGFAVPLFEFQGDRSALPEFACNMGPAKMDEYRHQKNQVSIDGLPTYLFEDRPTQKLGHYLLTYFKAPDYAERQAPFQEAHRDHVQAAVQRGDVILAGNLGSAADATAMLLFQSTSPAAAEAFAAADPYVVEGVVQRWQVQPWHTVLGALAAEPIAG